MIKFQNIRKALLFSIFFTLVFISCNKEWGIEKSKHVLIIGIDGALVSAVQSADTPNLDSLITNGAYTWHAYGGGILNTDTQQATSSGPAWSSILTGVWVNKHGVVDNNFGSMSIGVGNHN